MQSKPVVIKNKYKQINLDEFDKQMQANADRKRERHINTPVEDRFKLAKRGKGKVNCSLSLKDTYEYYRAKYKHQDKYKCTRAEYFNIMKDFSTIVRQKSIFEGKIIDFSPLGRMYIQKFKSPIGYLKRKKKLKINWSESMKYKRYIYHLNEHTNGYRMKINFLCNNFIKGTCYSFVPLRKFQRQLAEALKTTKGLDYMTKIIIDKS